MIDSFFVRLPLREKCPNMELFLVRIRTAYRKIRTRNNSVVGQFLRSVLAVRLVMIFWEYCHILQNSFSVEQL